MVATDIRQVELERDYQMERLREVCKESGIDIEILDYPLKKCIAYLEDISLVIIANNCNNFQIQSMINFILGTNTY